MFTVTPPMVKVGPDKQESDRAGKVQDDREGRDDDLADPRLPRAMACMLAPSFPGLGLVLLRVGKVELGFIGLVSSVIALVAGQARTDGRH